MADHGRDDTENRRGEHRPGGLFGRGWSGLGPDPRESRGYADDRASGWRGEERSAFYERDERGGRAGDGRRGAWGSGRREDGQGRMRSRGPDTGRERDFG